MKYFSSQQDTTYFHWQIETYLRNFERIGIDLSDCYIILLYDSKPSLKALELQQEYSDVNFFFYPLEERAYSYIAATKPYGMLKFFESFPYFDEPIFYHDADIIFTHKLDFSDLLKDKVCYMSKCLQNNGMSYIDLEYLRQFNGVIDTMSGIVGVKPKEHGGGAQYILKGTNREYWLKVYEDCFKLYKALTESNTKVQVWCAEMWATLWNLWYFDLETDLHPLLDFCMSRDPISELKPIVHNAGDMGAGCFDKRKYTNKYPNKGIKVNPKWCNYVYYREVEKIYYIREKGKVMGKITIIKDGCVDKETGKTYKIGDVVDLGDERNDNAVKGGVAKYIDETKKEPCKDCGGKKRTAKKK